LALQMLGGLTALIQGNPWQFLIGIALIFLLLVLILRSALASRMFGALAYQMPWTKRNLSGRFCRVLGTLLRNGAHLQSALRLSLEAMANHRVKDDGARMLEEVVGGAKLSRALGNLNVFDSSSLRLIAIGEETNRLDYMLLHVADRNETSVARSLQRFVTLLTPALTVLLGLMIGGLILSVMRVVLSLNELTQ
jgi:general secretion pathway protein F